ncbi:hypothetical protein [Rhodococcoides yunnanense]|uniref:Secreted protein n=1 Tax=Rhodococcoides yunnanense TaxID=278209 RepID=A0ABU4B6P4_9NOCA|nr:hypothetical protein [Rhodococcus yunnanensis]MDV6259811.1 hypothetical protein [Rhodococcus yunnanensis]
MKLASIVTSGIAALTLTLSVTPLAVTETRTLHQIQHRLLGGRHQHRIRLRVAPHPDVRYRGQRTDPPPADPPIESGHVSAGHPPPLSPAPAQSHRATGPR